VSPLKSNESITLRKCKEDYIKYADTVAVSSVIRKFIIDHQNVGKYEGEELTIITMNGRKITPDISCSYNSRKNALFFELKWSISPNTIKDELLDLKKYLEAKFSWEKKGTQNEHVDLVLVIHIDDANTVMSAIDGLCNMPENDFLNCEGFSVWGWSLSLPKLRNGTLVDEMRFNCLRGKTQNAEINKHISAPGGILISQDVLTHLRQIYRFIKEKPPIQYTMGQLYLLMSSLASDTQPRRTLAISRGLIDVLYERMKIYFPGWAKATPETIQVRKDWIGEAVDKFEEIGMKIIKIPTSRTRKQLQEFFCQKLEKLIKKRLKRRYAFPKTRPIPSGHDRKLTDFGSSMK